MILKVSLLTKIFHFNTPFREGRVFSKGECSFKESSFSSKFYSFVGPRLVQVGVCHNSTFNSQSGWKFHFSSTFSFSETHKASNIKKSQHVPAQTGVSEIRLSQPFTVTEKPTTEEAVEDGSEAEMMSTPITTDPVTLAEENATVRNRRKKPGKGKKPKSTTTGEWT